MANSLAVNKGKLPLILDEIFAYYDDERMEIAINYLRELAEDRTNFVLYLQKKRS